MKTKSNKGVNSHTKSMAQKDLLLLSHLFPHKVTARRDITKSLYFSSKKLRTHNG